MTDATMREEEASDLLRLLSESAARLAGQGTDRARGLRGRSPGFDRAVWTEMAKQGWTGVMAPATAGGQGLGLAAARALLDPVARTLAPEPLAAVAVEAAVLAAEAGRAAREVLEAIVAGEVVVVAAGGTLSLTGTGEERRLSGQVRHVPSAPGADRLLVVAGERSLLTLPAETAGLTISPEWRADGTCAGVLEFAGAAVPDSGVLAEGPSVAAALRRARSAALLAASVELFACMDRALDITLDYMKLREQFGRPIGAFQALQHRAVDLYIQKELSRAVLDEGIAAFDGGAAPDRLEREASRAKARCSHAALTIGREAIKLHGAIGVTDEHEIGLYLRRILSLAALHGNAEAHRLRADELSRALDAPEDTLPPPPAEFLSETRCDTDWNAFSEASFRSGIRAYFESRYPAHLRHLGRRGTPAEMSGWLDRMIAKGWMAPAWPRAQGGMGLSPARQLIFIEERERAGILRHPDQGVVMLGPMLMQHGTDAQKAAWLPRILANETIWCQGYSEPQAGSDLASLRTRAVKVEGGFVIDGSKIWTTMAHHATHMFLLARTDPEARKQAGLSFFLLDLASPGVTIRPIRNIAGHEEFCEVFFDKVRVPDENLVGPLNGGWTVAKSLLSFERLNNGSPRRVEGPLKRVAALARATGIENDPAYRSRFAAVSLDVADLKSAYARFAGLVGAGEMPGPEVSLLKVWAGDCAQRLTEFLIETAGEAGGVAGRQEFGGAEIDVLAPFYAMFPAQIASGTNDIQRNILATRVLGLPK